MRDWPRRRIALYRREHLPGKNSANLVIGMTRKVLAQVLGTASRFAIMRQQPLDSIGHLIGWAAIAHRTRNRLVLADSATNAEVIGIYHPSVLLDLFAFQSQVGDPV